jgi:hypothetical protein
MINQFSYDYICSILKDDALEEHQRIFQFIDSYWDDAFLSTYLTYCQTYHRLHKLLEVDPTTFDNPKEMWVHQSMTASILNQHNNAAKALKLTPASRNRSGIKTGRPQRDSLREKFSN